MVLYFVIGTAFVVYIEKKTKIGRILFKHFFFRAITTGADLMKRTLLTLTFILFNGILIVPRIRDLFCDSYADMFILALITLIVTTLLLRFQEKLKLRKTIVRAVGVYYFMALLFITFVDAVIIFINVSLALVWIMGELQRLFF